MHYRVFGLAMYICFLGFFVIEKTEALVRKGGGEFTFESTAGGRYWWMRFEALVEDTVQQSTSFHLFVSFVCVVGV